MGNNPASSVISGSDFFKENEHFSDEECSDIGAKSKAIDEDDEIASLMTMRTLTRVGNHHNRQNITSSRAMSRSPTMSITSKRSYSVQCHHPRPTADKQFYNRILSNRGDNTIIPRSSSSTSQTQSNQYNYKPNLSGTLAASSTRLSRKTINQNRLNESFYENLTEAKLVTSASIIEKTNEIITVEPLPQDALNWLQNAGITITSPLPRQTRPAPPPAPAPPVLPPPPSLSSTSACLVLWEAPKVVLNRRIRNLGITKADPLAYAAKFGDTLVSASNLPSIVKNIRPRNGAILAAESATMRLRDTIKLVGDVSALALLNQNRARELDPRRRFSIASETF